MSTPASRSSPWLLLPSSCIYSTLAGQWVGLGVNISWQPDGGYLFSPWMTCRSHRNQLKFACGQASHKQHSATGVVSVRLRCPLMTVLACKYAPLVVLCDLVHWCPSTEGQEIHCLHPHTLGKDQSMKASKHMVKYSDMYKVGIGLQSRVSSPTRCAPSFL